MNTDLMFSSKFDEWQTPAEVYSLLDMEYHFDCDICARAGHNRHPNYVTPIMDALGPKPWYEYGSTIFMNPPYGRHLNRWIQRAWETVYEYNNPVSRILHVVALIPARTDTSYWHRYCMNSAEIGLVEGRIKFIGGGAPAPFPSAVIVFQTNNRNAKLTRWRF